MLDLIELYKKYHIPLKGVIHVGAYTGSENAIYQRIGVSKILFVEANPEVYKKLVENTKSFSNVYSACWAISNRIGSCKLHVTSMDQSSSILPLKHHKIVYPTITEVRCIDVPSTTLDNLVKTLRLGFTDFNFLNIDIQGAELLAFQGAIDLLSNYIQVINTEVNYEEMYEGCALKKDIDLFLSRFGFECKEVIKSHPTWGDAFYVKKTI